MALFLKKNSFIPSKKAQEVESGFKRCNSDSQALQRINKRMESATGHLMESPFIKSSQARGWRQQLGQRAASSADVSHSWQHGSPEIHTPWGQTASQDSTMTWCTANQQPFNLRAACEQEEPKMVSYWQQVFDGSVPFHGSPVNSQKHNCSPGCLTFCASGLWQLPGKAPGIPISTGLPHNDRAVGNHLFCRFGHLSLDGRLWILGTGCRDQKLKCICKMNFYLLPGISGLTLLASRREKTEMRWTALNAASQVITTQFCSSQQRTIQLAASPPTSLTAPNRPTRFVRQD